MTDFTKSFSIAELRCKCGCGLLPSRQFMERVQELRDMMGIPFVVTSAMRCPAHNSKVSRTGLNGPHTTGRAIDIAMQGKDALTLVRLALAQNFTGIGVRHKGYSRFIHLDDRPPGEGRPRPTIWSY